MKDRKGRSPSSLLISEGLCLMKSIIEDVEKSGGKNGGPSEEKFLTVGMSPRWRRTMWLRRKKRMTEIKEEIRYSPYIWRVVYTEERYDGSRQRMLLCQLLRLVSPSSSLWRPQNATLAQSISQETTTPYLTIEPTLTSGHFFNESSYSSDWTNHNLTQAQYSLDKQKSWYLLFVRIDHFHSSTSTAAAT
ncbi:UNVERIFIED_CONTAM: hypothetical protein PYX00_006245 [Menopon gallinae]|uniref:Uncharacterized protein n=1 Tax=Menopon gallinae TaxID=328185 RepID=A0AAW2HVH8_9NEOP